MSSPIPGSKKMPKTVPLPNFKKKPVLEVDPKPGKPINLKPIKLGKDKPFPMPGILPDKLGAKKPKMISTPFPGPSMPKYSPIKFTKQVNKTYNTY